MRVKERGEGLKGGRMEMRGKFERKMKEKGRRERRKIERSIGKMRNVR